MLASVAISLLLALALIRWQAPALLGVPTDLQLVQVDEKVPPFFDGVFRPEDYESDESIIRDPHINRAKPLIPRGVNEGPHDILGFRNHQVPDVADVLVIGDSQTYGINVPIERNWPSVMQSLLTREQSIVYSMAVGGWAAPEYLEILSKGLRFQPRVIVVAFYTGNDPRESFSRVYGKKYLAYLRPNLELNAGDAPPIQYPPPRSDIWRVRFQDGVATAFSAKLRYASNQDHPIVRAGYEIMFRVAREIAAQTSNAKVLFTIIPTKELVYAKKVKQDSQLDPPDDYENLVSAEARNVDSLAMRLQSIEGAHYVDVYRPLEQAAMESQALYPNNSNGHPIARGYEVIARVLAPVVDSLLPSPPNDGLVAVDTGSGLDAFLIQNGKLFHFPSRELFEQNGWTLSKNVRIVRWRELSHLQPATVDAVDPDRFGPRK